MVTEERNYGDCIDFLENLGRAYTYKKKRTAFMRLASVGRDVQFLRDNYPDVWQEENGSYSFSTSAVMQSSSLTLRGIIGRYGEASFIINSDKKTAAFNRQRFREFLDDRIASPKAGDNLFSIMFGDGESLLSFALRRIPLLEPCISAIKKINLPDAGAVRLDKGEVDSLLKILWHFREIENAFAVDTGLYDKFIRDFRRLYRNTARIEIIGYGEISTVMQLRKGSWCADAGESAEHDSRWVWKKMPPFPSRDEVDRYSVLYHKYRKILNDEIGITVPGQMIRQFRHDDHYVVYAGQVKADERAVCNKLIKRLDLDSSRILLEKILEKLGDVHRFNTNNGNMKIGIDAQLSNWVLVSSGAGDAVAHADSLMYIDTSSPMIRIGGEEQINPEIFIKSAASFLRPIILSFFLQEVLDRYYDIRLVTIDIIANLYKEKRDDLIDSFIETANKFLKMTGITQEIINRKEIDSYYSSDAFIWKFYQASRKLDRFITEKILRKKYAFRIPGKIER